MKKTILLMILSAASMVGAVMAEQPSVAGSSNDPYVMKIYPDGTKVIVRWSEIGKAVDNGEKHGGAPRIVAYDPGKDGIVPIGSTMADSPGVASTPVKETMTVSKNGGSPEDLSGFYLMPTLGVSVMQNPNLKINQLGPTEDLIPGSTVEASGSIDLALNPGIRFDLPFGWNITDWFSLEFAPGIIWNSFESINAGGNLTIDNISIDGNASLTLGGNFIQVPLMANFIFKIPTETNWTPYVGGGIGGIYNHINISSLSGISYPGNPDDNCWSMGYQAIAGFDYECTQDISVGLRYIFTGSTEQNFQGDLSALSTKGSFTHTVNLSCTARF